MKFRETFRMAFRALERNKLPTALTLLGILIGIGAVICTVAIGEGGSSLIHDQLEGLGTNLVWIEAGGRNVKGVRTDNGETKSLTVAVMFSIGIGIFFGYYPARKASHNSIRSSSHRITRIAASRLGAGRFNFQQF